MQVYCGVSGFSYREWRGVFYPAGLKPEQMLAFYVRHLATTELNNTFYRLPDAEQLAGWSRAAPEGFLFAVKAPRSVTHVRRLVGVAPLLDDFLPRLAALGARLGPVLFQLPPNLKLDLARLDGFLAALAAAPDARGLRMALEFRHASWFDEAVFARLREHNIALVVGDDDELEPAPLMRTADFCYARLRKTAPYSVEALDAWKASLERLGGEQLFVYFRHEAHAPEQAAALRARFASA